MRSAKCWSDPPLIRRTLEAFKLCAFGIRVGLSLAVTGHPADAIKTAVYPVGYWRFLPMAYLLYYAAKNPSSRILDVASPKLVSLYLAHRNNVDVQATDLDDEKLFSRWKVAADALDAKNYHVSFQDARHLRFPDNYFDLVYSISVIEHIPEDGDTQALQEFQRVLKPGGIALVEVPYRRRAEMIYMPYTSKGVPSADGKPVFYERYYDSQSVDHRLKASGMTIENRLILGEWIRLDPLIATNRLPRLLRAAFLPFEPLFAAVNYWARPDDRKGRPLAALLVFRKCCDEVASKSSS
jgi:SAM-dependent methyltransferase